jgi:hypothetical protein
VCSPKAQGNTSYEPSTAMMTSFIADALRSHVVSKIRSIVPVLRDGDGRVVRSEGDSEWYSFSPVPLCYDRASELGRRRNLLR